MAKPNRILEQTTTWVYVGQKKPHDKVSYQAAHHDFTPIADAMNQHADVVDGQREYADACETGTARVIGRSERWVG